MAQSDAPEAQQSNSTSGVAWTVLARGASQVAQFVLLMIATRFLSVADFGVFALFSTTAFGLAVFARAGWRELIIASETEERMAHANLLAIVAGSVTSLISMLGSIGYGYLADDKQGMVLMLMLSAWIMPAALAAAQEGRLTVLNQVQRIGQIQTAAEVLGLAAGAVAFTSGAGLLSLAYSKLAYQLVAVGLLLLSSRWCPLVKFKREVCLEIVKFSKDVVATSMTNFGRNNVALYIVGAFAGPVEVGLFRAGIRLSNAMAEVIAEPARIYAWSVLREANRKGGTAGIRQAMGPFSNTVLLLGAPPLIALAACSESLITVVLGAKWSAAAPVAALVAISRALGLLRCTYTPVLAMTNKMALLPKITLIGTVVDLVSLAIFAPFGALWIAVSRVITSVVSMPLQFYGWRQGAGIDWWHDVHSGTVPIFVAVSAMAAACFGVGWALSDVHPAWTLASQIAVGIVVYFPLIFILAPSLSKGILNAVLKRKGPAAAVSSAST